MGKSVENIVADTFLDIAKGLETGNFGNVPKVALTGMGSEHGEENAMKAAVDATKFGIDVYYIGTLEDKAVTTIKVNNDEEGHKKMEELLNSGQVDAAVTMHYPFPIGVSTVGRTITPGKGKEMFLATTTGTSSANRIEGMILNAIYGVIAAKACGIKNPSVGILNVEGARQCEKALQELKSGGYDFNFAESSRADGGIVMRGNDLLQGSPDVMVCDSLTGNILSKMHSSFMTGGSFEAVGYGYGPGIGKDFDKVIGIVSRASGAPVITSAIKYMADVVRGNIAKITTEEFAEAEKAGLTKILDARKADSSKTSNTEEEIAAPPTEVVTEQIAGIEIMDLEDAVKAL